MDVVVRHGSEVIYDSVNSVYKYVHFLAMSAYGADYSIVRANEAVPTSILSRQRSQSLLSELNESIER